MLYKAPRLARRFLGLSPSLLVSFWPFFKVAVIMSDMKTSEVQYVDNKGACDGKLVPVQTNASYDEETLKQPTERLDYSGAAEKTDPVEIKLVKKLDWYIMPM